MFKYIRICVLAILSSFAILLKISLFKQLQNINYSIFYNINIVMLAIFAFLFFYLFYKNDSIKISKLKYALAIIFAIFMILGECYTEANSCIFMFKSVGTILVVLFKLIGYTHLFKIGFIYLDKLLFNVKFKTPKIKNKYLKKYLELFEKYPFKTSLISILAIWFIYIIAFYPIVLSPDSSFQIKQYFNVPTKYISWVIQRDPNVFMTTHHPVLQTFLLGWCIEFGRLLLNDNFGLFIYTFFQTMIYSSILAYSIKFAKNNDVNIYLRLGLVLIYMFVPMFGFYSVSSVKDTLYTAFMMLFVLYLYKLIKEPNNKFSLKNCLYFSFITLFMCLFRHNGIYIVLLTLPFIILVLKSNRIRVFISLSASLVVLLAFNNVLIPYLGISNGSIREMFSVPFQQTARYVKYYGDELTSEEIKAIDKVLDYSDLAKRYNPELADNVKNKYNKYTTNEDLKNYFNVWWKCFLKHPGTYVDATLNNVYGYIYPNAHNWYLYSKYDARVTQNNLVDYNFNNLVFLRDTLTMYGNIFPYIPVIGLLSSIGFNTWMLLIIAVYLIETKKSKFLVPFIPLYGSVIFCLIGPANTYFRYAMPYVFIIPILLILLLKDIRGEGNEENIRK